MLLRCRFVSSLLMATRQTFSCSIHADGCCSWTYRNLYVTICESQDLEMRVEGTVRFFEPVATSFYLFFLRRLERRGKKKAQGQISKEQKKLWLDRCGYAGDIFHTHRRRPDYFSLMNYYRRFVFVRRGRFFFFSFQNWGKETCCCHIVCSPRQSDIINSNR